MKCEFCGANIDIETDKCPYCGMTKSQFKKHRADIKEFQKAYEKVEGTVVEKNRRTTEKTVRVTIVIALCLMNLIMIILIGNGYKINEAIKSSKMNSNKEYYLSNLNQYEENEDYIGFDSYYNYNQLYMVRKYNWIDEYALLSRMCSILNRSVEYICEINYYLNDEDDYYNIDRNLEYFVDSYEELLKLYKDYVIEDRNSYMYKESCYSEKHLESYDNIMQYMEWYVEAYMGISEEDYPAFKEANKARKIIMIEEGLDYEQ